MKTIFTLLSIFTISMYCKAQSTYNASSYAAIGDAVYLTSAQIDTTNYIKGGANYTWDYHALKATSQQNLAFRNPKSTGFTQLQWPYIYNTANVNLSSTNGQSVALGQLEETNSNDYYLLNTGVLAEKASSFNIAYSNVAFNIKNTYTSADTLYKFPLAYTDTFASTAQYTTTLPGIYYNMQTLQRTNKVDGWGTIITPYGTFTRCLRVVSNVVQVDTFAIYGTGLPKDTIQYRELKWLDNTKNYPVLYIKQTFAAGKYTTVQVQYYDKQQYFQPKALFAYVPLHPVINDTITFQNLSTNSTSYKWSFGDGTTSTLTNPQHIYSTMGTYIVQLTAINGTLTSLVLDTITVTGNPKAAFTYTPANPVVNQVIQFQNLSLNAIVIYYWTFGDGGIAYVANPVYRYSNPGVYVVKLLVVNAYGYKDSISENITVTSASLPVQLVSLTGAKQKSGNLLRWTTATETNTAYFGVERSLDGLSFANIGKITAAGNSNALLNYSFEDVNAIAGNTYYRLKIMDEDGHFTYSNILVLKDAANNVPLIALYPNPVVRSGSATVLITALSAGNATITLYDVNGKAVAVKHAMLAAGANIINLPANNLPIGTYFATYRAADGGLAGSVRFVVAH